MDIKIEMIKIENYSRINHKNAIPVEIVDILMIATIFELLCVEPYSWTYFSIDLCFILVKFYFNLHIAYREMCHHFELIEIEMYPTLVLNLLIFYTKYIICIYGEKCNHQ